MGTNQPIIVLITAPSQEIGEKIAKTLLDARLAACVNIVASITSLYLWQGKTHQDHEALLVVKSQMLLFKELEAAVLAIHPYQTPEIIALPIIDGHSAYLSWIEHETRR